MIEEKMIISFTEYLSYFDDEGKYINDTAKGNAEWCIRAINEAVNRFIAGVSSIAHHGFNLDGGNFKAEVKVSTDGSDASLNITRVDCSGVLAMYCFEPSMNLVLTKSFNAVSIEED